MIWKIELDPRAADALKKIDAQTAKRIIRYLRERIATDQDPRRFGHALIGSLSGLWRYRVGDYRVIAEIQNEKIIVLIVHIGHRSKIYGGH